MARTRPTRRRRKPVRAKRCPKGKKLKKTVHRHRGGKRHTHLRCVPKRKRRRPQLPVVTPPPVESPPAPPAPPLPSSQPAVGISGLPVYAGPFGPRQAERLLWRAGFGPAPGQAEALAALGLRGAVGALTRPLTAEQLIGPEPRGAGGVPIDPFVGDGHDHLWWLDRMVRTNRPFVERSTLVWHDWFATSNAGPVNSRRLMLEQNDLFRSAGRGSFHELLEKVTCNGAMLKWLNGWVNKKGKPDENYGRELMELFTLGADRGAYTESDVREMGRAHTGWIAQHSDALGFYDFQPAINTNLHDAGTKTIFGKQGNFTWRDAARMCVEHPMHASFLVNKLWGYFIPTPPDDQTRSRMEQAYTANSYNLHQLFEAILLHPDLYEGEPLVKPPVVFAAGLLRARQRGVQGAMLTWCEVAGQRLFYPPNVSGWNDSAWLDTTTMRARWMMVSSLLNDSWIDTASAAGRAYDPTESPSTAVARALAYWGNPAFSAESRGALESWAGRCLPVITTQLEASQVRAVRQNALRHLVGVSPDLQVS
jgi:hypothetical protein